VQQRLTAQAQTKQQATALAEAFTKILNLHRDESMADVFLSYSRTDKAFVYRLADALAEKGIEVWIDRSDIPSSADWLVEIEKGIEDASFFVFVVSPESLASRMCNIELGHALKARKRVIPVMHREVVVSRTLLPEIVAAWFDQEWEETARGNWRSIQKIQWLDYSAEDDLDGPLNGIIQTIKPDLEHVKLNARLLERARRWRDGGNDKNLLLRGIELQEAVYWASVSEGKDPEPARLNLELIHASEAEQARSVKIQEYLTIRNTAMREYVLPYLRQRHETLEHEYSEAVKRYASSTVRFDLRQELAVVTNFLGEGGKWHPRAAVVAQNAGPRDDYENIHRFPCCGAWAPGDRTPSQFRDDGCEVAPALD
jgi:hypothetical protein